MYLCHFNYHFVLIVLTQHRQGSFLTYPAGDSSYYMIIFNNGNYINN